MHHQEPSDIVTNTPTIHPPKRQHELWREGINDHDNEPMVRRRDGTLQPLEKLRGFINYQRNPEPYRDPLERVTDWGELNPTSEDIDLKHNETERR